MLPFDDVIMTNKAAFITCMGSCTKSPLPGVQVTLLRLNVSVNCAIISSDKGFFPNRQQTIIWTNAGFFFIAIIGPYETFSEILMKSQQFSSKKLSMKMTSTKWLPYYLVLIFFQSACNWHLIDLTSELCHVFCKSKFSAISFLLSCWIAISRNNCIMVSLISNAISTCKFSINS